MIYFRGITGLPTAHNFKILLIFISSIDIGILLLSIQKRTQFSITDT